jgi:hypothetical protein
MSIPVLLADLQRRGIVLSVADGALKFRAPKDALTPADREQLSARRAAIVTYLLAREAGRGLRAAQGHAGPLTASVAQEMWHRFAGGPDEGKPVALNIMMIGLFRDTAPAALSRAIMDVIRRHDTLRSHIKVHGETLELSLNDADEFAVGREDLSGLDAEAAEADARRRAMAYCSAVNPIEGRWLGRARVYALPGHAAVAALSFNHIVADAGSRNIVLNELQDALSGRSIESARVAYNDFSLAERDYLAGPQGERLIAYWRQWYAQCPMLCSPQEKAPLLWGNGIRIVNNFVMPRRVLQAVRSQAEALRTTAFAVHMSIFARALARWSGGEDFAVRVLGDKRVSMELADTVGLMFCGDPVPVHAPAGEDFEILLRRLMKEYDASLSLRLPTLHFYPPQCVRPGIEPMDLPNRIPAVFNYYSAGTEREKAAWESRPDDTAALAWPPQMQQMPPALWTRRSAPVFLHIMDYGPKADCSLHFFADVVSEAEQRAFAHILFAVYQEVAPA